MSSVYVVCWIFLQTFQTYFCIQANSVDPDQTAPRGAIWSGSTLFAKMTFKITSRWHSRRQLLYWKFYPSILKRRLTQQKRICFSKVVALIVKKKKKTPKIEVANWSASVLCAKSWYTRVQQDKGEGIACFQKGEILCGQDDLLEGLSIHFKAIFYLLSYCEKHPGGPVVTTSD